MKKTKKVLSVLLVALMAFAVSAVTVFAAPTKGTIEVTGAKKDQTYTLYKLFDAKITFKDDDTQRAIKWHFTTADARTKLISLYPTFPQCNSL